MSPILTYGGHATLKWGVKPEDHAIVYVGREPPEILECESSALMRPIEVAGHSPRDRLDRESRINYGKIYTVEHNVNVRFFGRVAESSKKNFFEDFDMVWSRKTNSVEADADQANHESSYSNIQDKFARQRRIENPDLEVVRRMFQPAIDPQYGDLLPLPPTDAEPLDMEPLDEFPGLPVSRPVTPGPDSTTATTAQAA